MNSAKSILVAVAVASVAIAAHADTTTPGTLDKLTGRTLRVVHPDEMVTLECRTDRVTISVDKDNKITNVVFC